MTPAGDKVFILDQSDDSLGISGESSPTGYITPNLVIPEARDGLFDCDGEKGLQQVSTSAF
jgi:hypothetical protein